MRLVLALQMGRSEAAKRGQSITVCASADGDTCSGATNWATGWIVTPPAPRTRFAWNVRLCQAEG